MNWTETRQRLLELLPDREVPEEWRPGIDLSGANLRGAYLSGADLRDANLSFTADLWTFTAGRHTAYFQPSTGWMKIGCLEHPVAHWLENFEAIGQANEYPPDAIARYGAFIRMCAAASPAAQ